MKNTLFILTSSWIFVFLSAYDSQANISSSYQNLYCDKPKVEIMDDNIDKYWDYSVEKTTTNFVLDYFQDPSSTGVSLTVTIRSTELVATVYKWENVCTLYTSKQEGMTECVYTGEPKEGYDYAYLDQQCVPQPEEQTYRLIETGSVSIWLEPSPTTHDLLGPGPYLPDTEKPVLRYLYPDQWAIVKVQPGKNKIVERPWFKDADAVKTWLAQNKDYVILESSAKSHEFTTRLARMTSPTTSKGALGLVNLGNCWANIDEINHNVCDPKATQSNAYGVTEYTITLTKIPLDVPGEWHVGVDFYHWPAKFDGGQGEEDLGIGVYRQYNFSTKEMEERFSFESYIIRSAPCNPDELGGCWDKVEENE